MSHIFDNLEQFTDEETHGDLFLFPQVEHVSVQTVFNRPPLVLCQQSPSVASPGLIALAQAYQLGNDHLNECGDSDDLIDPGRAVTDPYLQCGELGMRTDVPPDLGRFVDAAGADECLHEGIVLFGRVKMLGKSGSRKILEDNAAVGFQAGVLAQPEGRRC